MNKSIFALLITACVTISGCGDNSKTESGGGSLEPSRTETSMTTEDGNILSVSYDETVNPNDVMKLEYSLKTDEGESTSGTIHWGDNSDTRINGEGIAYHRYVATGEYKIAAQPDNDEKVAIGRVKVDTSQNLNGSDEITDTCRITGINVSPKNTTVKTNVRFNVIVDFEVYDIRLSPIHNPPRASFYVNGKIFFESDGSFSNSFDYITTYTFSQTKIDKGQIHLGGKLSQTNSEYGPDTFYGWVGFFPGSYVDEATVRIASSSGAGGCNMTIPLRLQFD